MIVDGVRPCVSVEFVTSRVSQSQPRTCPRTCCVVLCCLLNCRQCLSADRHLFYRTRPEFRHARPTLQNCYTTCSVFTVLGYAHFVWSYLLLAHCRRSVPGSADTFYDSILPNEDNLFSISDLPSENRNVFASLGELTAILIIIVTHVNTVKLSRTPQYVSASQDQIPCSFRHLWWLKSLTFRFVKTFQKCQVYVFGLHWTIMTLRIEQIMIVGHWVQITWICQR